MDNTKEGRLVNRPPILAGTDDRSSYVNLRMFFSQF